MDIDSGDRSDQVQDDENNDSREQSHIPVSLERYRNEEKDSLANRKQESQSRVTKNKEKESKNQKFLSVEKIQILFQLTLLHQQKRKRKPNVGDITNQHHHLPQLPAIQVPMRNHTMKKMKMKNLN